MHSDWVLPTYENEMEEEEDQRELGQHRSVSTGSDDDALTTKSTYLTRISPMLMLFGLLLTVFASLMILQQSTVFSQGTWMGSNHEEYNYNVVDDFLREMDLAESRRRMYEGDSSDFESSPAARKVTGAKRVAAAPPPAQVSRTESILPSEKYRDAIIDSINGQFPNGLSNFFEIVWTPMARKEMMRGFSVSQHDKPNGQSTNTELFIGVDFTNALNVPNQAQIREILNLLANHFRSLTTMSGEHEENQNAFVVGDIQLDQETSDMYFYIWTRKHDALLQQYASVVITTIEKKFPEGLLPDTFKLYYSYVRPPGIGFWIFNDEEGDDQIGHYLSLLPPGAKDKQIWGIMSKLLEHYNKIDGYQVSEIHEEVTDSRLRAHLWFQVEHYLLSKID